MKVAYRNPEHCKNQDGSYYPYGLKIAGISSKKLSDAAEGRIKNTDLYNDKELDEEGDLNWYDYGFRSYDPQIGRFIQIDVLCDSYTDLNPYEYAGLDPINNVDIDGLGIGEVITLAEVTITSSAKASAHIAGSITSQILQISGRVSISVTAAAIANIGGSLATNAVGAGSVDPPKKKVTSAMEQTKSLVNKKMVDDVGAGVKLFLHPAGSIKQTAWDKFYSWLNKVSHGEGSYQDIGIVFTGNGSGSMEFRDHAGKTVDAVDLGTLFSGLKAAGLDADVFKEILKSPGGLKYLVSQLEAGQTVRDAVESFQETAEATKENFGREKVTLKNSKPVKADSIYVDDYKYETSSKGDTIKTTWQLKLVPKIKK